ncbi:hypothetical protein PoB_004565800 [Plakobranchus ocellatus]|uniref:Amidase domain-containing protein n=1 Tax=Plakobranchus ocellatus TaxID=259542 RepID=A0AAV4BK44_9GAST|nr:hypothetical protein PoB_004565800 [Plakobranchus ocellatus]
MDQAYLLLLTNEDGPRNADSVDIADVMKTRSPDCFPRGEQTAQTNDELEWLDYDVCFVPDFSTVGHDGVLFPFKATHPVPDETQYSERGFPKLCLQVGMMQAYDKWFSLEESARTEKV